ncbi:MAG: (Fe-S)-binding protein [Leptospiraceae bacterium]|nr:(Fe-S)-binding protein [Leptospiraceae bacterium]
MEILKIVIFAILFFCAHGLALSAVFRYWKYAHLGTVMEIHTSLWDKIKNVVVNVFFQKKLFNRPVRGLFHVFIFFGFIVYALHTLSQFMGGFFANYDFYIPALIDKYLFRGFLYFYDYLLDLFTFLVLCGLVFFALRRWVFLAPELDRPSGQSAIVLIMIALLMVATLLSEPSRVIKDGLSFEHLSPLRSFLVRLLQNWGISPQEAQSTYLIGWWSHVLLVFGFMVYVPRSKHAHLIWAPVNFWFHKGTPKGALSFMDLEKASVYGASQVQDFTWKDHLNGLSCIECGRCTLECPANRTGKVLDPKAIMMDLKHALMEKMPRVEELRRQGKSEEELAQDTTLRVIDNYTPTEALWACTTCYACVEACPVGNNQVDAIIAMRRALVLNEGSLPTDLQGALTNMENQSNPWGVGSHKREEWAEGLAVKTMAQWQSEGQSPEILYWVGCAGAFDERSKKIARSFVKLLQKAGISFGILGVEENCTGDSARRAGNEYLFQTLASANIETLNRYGVRKIVTTCPHCYNTLKNEYPQLGGKYEVEHHTVFLDRLLKEKKLKIDEAKKSLFGYITYHDSCYLGRYNDHYEEPRRILKQVTQFRLLEPIDHKRRGLCCGAGGAQMWKEEEKGRERVNYKRTEQLLLTEAKTIASACPFCMTMISDGVKAHGHEEKVETLDVAEILEKVVI